MTSAPQSRKERFKKRMRIPLIIALFALTIAAMIPDVRSYIADSEALHWSEVPATISAIQFEIPVRLKDPYFKPHVEYKYTIAGRELTGDRISIGSPLLGYDMAQYEKGHPVGKEVTVRVDPEKPENAILEPKPDLVSLIGRAMAVAMFFSLVYLSTYPLVLSRQQPSQLKVHRYTSGTMIGPDPYLRSAGN